MSTAYQNFNAITVPLQGSNLIEASAGTGKTYSIAILALRLVVEKNIPIQQLLMVTFTKAAVAELEERIRLFIRSGYQVALGQLIKDGKIKEIVEQEIQKSGSDLVRQRLKNAVLNLDETSVLTIHSFCQQTLTQFAFETGQAFGQEPLEDKSGVLADEVNAFWRKYVSVIPVVLLRHLCIAGLSRAHITTILNAHLGHKQYPVHDAAKHYKLDEDDCRRYIDEIEEISEVIEVKRHDLEIEVEANRQDLEHKALTNAHAKKVLLLTQIDDFGKFTAFISEKHDKVYIQKLYPDILLALAEIDEETLKLKEICLAYNDKLYCLAIQEISEKFAQQKAINNQMDFDDMITNLHKAVTSPNNSPLIKLLQAQYQAVFIDEFQDTDKLQYEIFNTAFGKNTILFYIGDPKQSIYSFRSADIFTYFEAGKGVDHHYQMGINFRSTPAYIAAMNHFFQPEEGFDTFGFAHKKSIDYIPVSSLHTQNNLGVSYENELQPALKIIEADNNGEIVASVTHQVANLLSEGVLQTTNGKRRITPSDIGILVRKNSQAVLVKNALAKVGIPAIAIGDSKVLQSAETRQLLFVLDAMLHSHSGKINRALLGTLANKNIDDLLKFDEEILVPQFKEYLNIWNEDGVYAALLKFTKDFNFYENLIISKLEGGDRMMGNVMQIIELLHNTQTKKQLTPIELTSWLNRAVEGLGVEGDEFVQRIESDEDAVKIVTIHKSKGLEYNIVLAPFLDFFHKERDFYAFKDEGTNVYLNAFRKRISADQLQQFKAQQLQEDRRLIYVAITRAVYNCIVFRSNHYKISPLSPFTSALKANPNSAIRFEPLQVGRNEKIAVKSTPDEIASTKIATRFKLINDRWQKLSYSKISGKSAALRFDASDGVVEGYNNFVFKDLQRGILTGDMLHYLFENLDFQAPDAWKWTIKNTLKRYPYVADEGSLSEMIYHTLSAIIKTPTQNFSLSAIASAKKLNELEFDFPIDQLATEELLLLAEDGQQLHCNPVHITGGMMNGKIDLFFEHNGQYFILDWKSNYIGNDVSAYTQAEINTVMNDHNYHLQYLIYTLAVDKYLKRKLKNYSYDKHFGGVVYIFLRGARAGQNSGVFFTKPPAQQVRKLDEVMRNVV